jgi:hypothetical protein
MKASWEIADQNGGIPISEDDSFTDRFPMVYHVRTVRPVVTMAALRQVEHLDKLMRELLVKVKWST